jgi:hypothetical protein
MSLKVPQVGLSQMLNWLKAGFPVLTLRLYMNDHNPGDLDTAANYSEAAFSGYAAVDISNWADAVANPDGLHWQIQATAITFNHNGGPQAANIYGYFVTRPGGLTPPVPEVVWAERFSNPPIAMGVAGDFITVVPVLQDRSEF